MADSHNKVDAMLDKVKSKHNKLYSEYNYCRELFAYVIWSRDHEIYRTLMLLYMLFIMCVTIYS